MTYCISDDEGDVQALARVVVQLRRLRDVLEEDGLSWSDGPEGLQSRYSRSERVLRWIVDDLCEDHDRLMDQVYADDDHRLAEHTGELETYRAQDYDVEQALRTLSRVMTPLDRVIDRELVQADPAATAKAYLDRMTMGEGGE